MSTYYIVDENGEYLSYDKTKRYRRLSGAQLYRYLISPEAKGKRFYYDEETDVGIEITPELVPEFRKEERRKQYISDTEKEYPYDCIFLYQMELSDGISGEDIIPDATVNVEETAILHIRINELYNALGFLNDDERFYINMLYLSHNRVTQKQLALRLGVSQQTISVQCRAILQKLHYYMSQEK